MKSKGIKIIGALMVVVSVFTLCACEDFTLFEEEVTTTRKTTTTTIIGEREHALNYFNTAMNSLKGTFEKNTAIPDTTDSSADRPSFSYNIKKSASKFDCEDKVLKANLSGLANKILDQKDKGDYNPTAKDESGKLLDPDFKTLNELLPVKDQDWVSKLTIDDIKDIQWIDKSESKNRVVVLLGEEENPVVGEGIYGKIFNIGDKEAILETFKSAESYFKVSDYSTLYHDGVIDCTIDKETDRVLSFTYSKAVTVTAEGEGTGNLKSLGKQTITFEYKETYEYSFNYNQVDGITVPAEEEK